jgi:hypothetical protein
LANDHVFAEGWHRLEGGADRRFRWSRRRAEIRLGGRTGRWLTCHAFTSHPDAGQRPVTARFLHKASGQEVGVVILTSRDRVRVNLPLPPGEGVLEVLVDRPWVPKLVVDGSEDSRELGIALEDVELRNEPVETSSAGARTPWAGILSRLRTGGRRPAAH